MDVIFLLISVLVVVVVVGLLALVKGYEFFKRKRQGYYREEEIEAAILPYVYMAICVAFKASEAVLDRFGERLQGVDKKKLADYVYDVLPPYVSVAGIRVPVRILVTREQFSGLVQRVYDRFLGFYRENEASFVREAERWLAENK